MSFRTYVLLDIRLLDARPLSSFHPIHKCLESIRSLRLAENSRVDISFLKLAFCSATMQALENKLKQMQQEKEWLVQGLDRVQNSAEERAQMLKETSRRLLDLGRWKG